MSFICLATATENQSNTTTYIAFSVLEMYKKLHHYYGINADMFEELCVTKHLSIKFEDLTVDLTIDSSNNDVQEDIAKDKEVERLTALVESLQESNRGYKSTLDSQTAAIKEALSHLDDSELYEYSANVTDAVNRLKAVL